MYKISIDNNAGFCFGVVNAVNLAGQNVINNNGLYSLGQIVHNPVEMERLQTLGVTVIDHKKLAQLKNTTILFRAHGEPPESYLLAKQNGNKIIDATCPVVLKLQQRIAQAYKRVEPEKGQVIIFGKKGHAEVIGLTGQINNKAIVIETNDDYKLYNPEKITEVFSQTTASPIKFQQLVNYINSVKQNTVIIHDTICRQVSGRAVKLEKFVTQNQVIIFVGGKNSSNAAELFKVCKQFNSNSYFIESVNEIDCNWFKNVETIGISGATSTPRWLLDNVANYIEGNCYLNRLSK